MFNYWLWFWCNLGCNFISKLMATKSYNVGSYENPIYLIGNAKNWTLIEGGISAQFIEVKQKLFSIIGDLNHIKHWIILHTHYDHCGLVSYLYSSLSEVKIYAGEIAITKLNKDKGIFVIENLNNEVIALKEKEETFNKISKTSFKNIQINQLKEKQTLTCGNELSFTVIPTPGHSNCSISLYEKFSGRLFVSDALGEFFTPKDWFPLAFDNISNYLNSISLLSTTNPKSIALGHSEYIKQEDVKKAFESSLTCTNKLIDKIQIQLRSNSKDTIIEKLHEKYIHNSKDFVPKHLHYLSMKRLVRLIEVY